MKLIDEITALLPNRASRWIALLTIIATPLSYQYCPDLFSLFPKLQESNKVLLRLLLTETVALFGLSLLVASLIFYNHKLPNIKPILEAANKRMKKIGVGVLLPRFGVYWDDSKEPYCPSCKTLLSQSVFDLDAGKKTRLECMKCGEYLSLINNGKEIYLEEARALLNKT